MAQQVNPDNLYQKSREDLLLYEDARTNSLFNGTANFYLTRNDQSIWGAFLRALAKELARLEYDYAYDLVGKEPQYLTPPDIKRRWATPLFISSAYPATNGSDLGTGQSDLSYRNMLVALLAAYKEGATVKAIQDVIFAYTGIQVVVQELYTLIGNGVYDQSDRNAIRVSVNVGGTNPLADITTLNQLQLIVNSLYTAIDLTKPAHVGLEFTTVFGSDENIDEYTDDISEFPTDMWSPIEPGISDSLTVVFRLVEEPPFNPMLIVAPVLDPLNPKTTVAPYGRQFAGAMLSIPEAQWAALPDITFLVTSTVADGNTATFTYVGASYAIHEGMQVTITGCTNGGNAFNITGKISACTDPQDLGAGQFTMQLSETIALANEPTGFGLVTPTIQSAYAPGPSGSFVIGMSNWAALTDFFVGQFIMDTNGNTQLVVNTGPGSPPTAFGTSGATMPTFNFALTQSLGLFSGSTTYEGTITGGANNFYAGRTFDITGFANPDNNGLFFCLASTATSITLSNVVGVAEIHVGNAAVSAWSVTLNGLTTDGTLTWRMIGFGQVYTPSYVWVQLLVPGVPSITNPLPPTGEIGNWDIDHPMGLVAPRLKQAWEISGGDNLQSFEMN